MMLFCGPEGLVGACVGGAFVLVWADGFMGALVSTRSPGCSRLPCFGVACAFGLCH